MPLEGREKCVFKCVNFKGVERHIFSTLDRARVTLPPASNLYAKLGYLNLNSNLYFLLNHHQQSNITLGVSHL